MKNVKKSAITREEDKIKKSIKEAAKRGDQTVTKMLAKELIQSRKVKNRLATSKAQMNSVVMQLQEQLGMNFVVLSFEFLEGFSQGMSNYFFISFALSYYDILLATLKLAGAMKKNTEIMKMVNNLVKLPELQKTMMELQREMMKVPHPWPLSFLLFSEGQLTLSVCLSALGGNY